MTLTLEEALELIEELQNRINELEIDRKIAYKLGYTACVQKIKNAVIDDYEKEEMQNKNLDS